MQVVFDDVMDKTKVKPIILRIICKLSVFEPAHPIASCDPERILSIGVESLNSVLDQPIFFSVGSEHAISIARQTDPGANPYVSFVVFYERFHRIRSEPICRCKNLCGFAVVSNDPV